jgi:hypothetical protein
LFQIQDAAAREIPSAIVVGDKPATERPEAMLATEQAEPTSRRALLTVSVASFPTVSDFDEPRGGVEQNGAGRSAAVPNPLACGNGSVDAAECTRDIDADTASTDAPGVELQEDTADRLDKWFRSEKSRLETSGTPNDRRERLSDARDEMGAAGDENSGTTIGDYGSAAAASEVDDDIVLEPVDIDNDADWDDAETMDCLPCDVDRPPDENHNQELESPAVGRGYGRSESSSVRPQSKEPPLIFIPPGHIPRRRRSTVRTLVASVVGGVVGIALGYYALLWIAGPSGDFLNVAQHLPAAILPTDLKLAIAMQSDTDGLTELQAGYTTAADNDDTLSSPGKYSDRRAADASAAHTDEPQEVEVSEAQPLEGEDVAEAGQILNPPSFTADELAVALETAQQSLPKLVAGDLSDGQKVQRAKGLSYSLLCELAQKAAFVDATSRVEYIKPLANEATALFRQTLTDAHTRDEVALIARKWIESPHRKHGGVFFAGTLINEVDKGSVVECQFDVGGPAPLMVVVPQNNIDQLTQRSRPLGVVGWIVDSPAEQVSGYTGEAKQAIWASQLIPLE